MDAWMCLVCRASNDGAERSCMRCGSTPDRVGPAATRPAWAGVDVVRDVHQDAVAAALTGRTGAGGQPILEPFFHLEQSPRWPTLHRVLALWPLLVLLVVLLFFAVAGLQR